MFTPEEKKAVDELMSNYRDKWESEAVITYPYMLGGGHKEQRLAVCAIVNFYREYIAQPGPDDLFKKHPRPWRNRGYISSIDIVDANGCDVKLEYSSVLTYLANTWQPAQPARNEATDRENVIREFVEWINDSDIPFSIDRKMIADFLASKGAATKHPEPQAKQSEVIDYPIDIRKLHQVLNELSKRLSDLEEADFRRRKPPHPLVGRRVSYYDQNADCLIKEGVISNVKDQEMVITGFDENERKVMLPYLLATWQRFWKLIDDEPKPAEQEFNLFLNTLNRMEARVQALEAKQTFSTSCSNVGYVGVPSV